MHAFRVLAVKSQPDSDAYLSLVVLLPFDANSLDGLDIAVAVVDKALGLDEELTGIL